MPSRLFLDEEEIEIRKIYESGISAAPIAAVFHCGADAILSAVRRQGGTARPHNHLTKRGLENVRRASKGRKLSKSARRKISKARKGRKLSKAQREQIAKTLREYYQDHPAPLSGKHRSEATREKLSKANKGQVPWNTGKRRSSETRRKISESLNGKMSGPKNPAWKGGVSTKPYPFEFNSGLKEEIRERDGHECQLCGAPEANFSRALDVHHIDYDKENCSSGNLIALCRSCNGSVNKNREFWTGHFKALLDSQ